MDRCRESSQSLRVRPFADEAIIGGELPRLQDLAHEVLYTGIYTSNGVSHSYMTAYEPMREQLKQR